MNDYSDLFLQAFSFWPQLSAAEKERLSAATAPVHFSAGRVIHGGGDDCLGVLLLKQGQLRTALLSEEGRDITLYRLYPGDVCILSASCVLEAITFDVVITAEAETEALQISAATFSWLCQKNIYVRCFSYQLTTQRFSDVMWAMQQLLFMSADKRLAIFLLDELSKTGSPVLQLTQEQIARYMGSAREVVSRLLKYFSQEGLVTLHRGGLKILDKARLRAITQT